MIHSMAAARSAANDHAEAPQILAAAPGEQPAMLEQQATAPLPFAEQLAQLGDSSEEPMQAPVEPMPGMPQPAQVEPAVEPAEQAQTQPSTAEQWLLGMLGQQQLQIDARESAAEPVPAGAPRTLPGMVQPQPAPLAERSPEPEFERALVADAGQPRKGEAAVPPAPVEISRGSALANTPATGQPVAAPAAAAIELAAATPIEAAAPSLQQAPGSEQAVPIERAQPASASEGTLRLQAPQARWGEQMLQALREHVDVQLQQKVQSATLRLDPPELGALEIFVSHESGRLTVQLSAAQADVARLLQQTSDRLRQELVAQHFVQVSVQVGADGQSGRQGQRREDAPFAEPDPIAAAQHPARQQDPHAARGTRDVLVTV